MKENSVNHAMNALFSVDDFSDSFLSSSPSSPPPPVPATFHAYSMNGSSQSDWDFEKLLEEVTGNPGSISSLSVSDSSIPAVFGPSVESRSSVTSRVEGIGNDDVKIKKPYRDQAVAHPLNPSSSASVDSDEYRAYLKSKLDLACAAVALRVSLCSPHPRPRPRPRPLCIYPTRTKR